MLQKVILNNPLHLSPAPERPRTAPCLLFVPSSVRQTAGLVCQPKTQRGSSLSAQTGRRAHTRGADPAALRLWARLERNPEEEPLLRLWVERVGGGSDGCVLQPRTERWRLWRSSDTGEGGGCREARTCCTTAKSETWGFRWGGRLARCYSLEAEGSEQEGNHRLHTDKSLIRAGRSPGGEALSDQATGAVGVLCGMQLRHHQESPVSDGY